MKRLTLAVAMLALAAGCATSNTTPASSATTAAAKADGENTRCERYKPIGSNMTERRCYVIGSAEDEAARKAQDAELRRRSRGG